MSKVVRALALVCAMAIVTVGAVSVADGQVKDKDKKVEKLGTVEVYKAKDGYRFRVKGLDGKTVMMSAKAYPKKEDAKVALDFAKDTLDKAKVTEIDDEK